MHILTENRTGARFFKDVYRAVCSRNRPRSMVIIVNPITSSLFNKKNLLTIANGNRHRDNEVMIGMNF